MKIFTQKKKKKKKKGNRDRYMKIKSFRYFGWDECKHILEIEIDMEIKKIRDNKWYGNQY